MSAEIEAVLSILRLRYEEAYHEYRACLAEHSKLDGQPAPAAMRARETAAAYKLAETRTMFDEALDTLANSTRDAAHVMTGPQHECDQDGEWVEVIDESDDPLTASEAPTCSVCGDAQVVASRGVA